MSRGWFVTGTDTGVGKTFVTCALLKALAGSGRCVAGMKPVATGCRMTPDGLRSDDAEALIAASNVVCGYDDVNPFAFEPATAPHIAANAEGRTIAIDVIRARYERLAARADLVVVEGVGGWLVPISEHSTMADVARELRLPVILVVGVRLGAINHALLTSAAITSSGCTFAGWVANIPQPHAPDHYVETMRDAIRAPFLGVIPHGASLEQAGRTLKLAEIDPAGEKPSF